MGRRLAVTALLGLTMLAPVTGWGDDPKPPPAPAEDPDPSFLEFLGSVDRLAEVNPDYLTPVGRPPGAAPPRLGGVTFLIDECISPSLSQPPNMHGLHEAIHLRNRGRLREPDHMILTLNLLLLLWIAELPFATDLMGDHKQLVLPCEIYGVTLISISAVSFMHLEYMMHHPYLTTREFTHDIAVMLKHRILWFTLIPVASMIAAFYSTHAAVYMYMMLVFAHFLTSRIDERIHCEPPSPPDAAPRE